MQFQKISSQELILIRANRYATEIDIHFARKSVRAIGKLAIKIEAAAQVCIDSLLELVATKVNYIVQEATVVIRNIFRKYPNRYESIIRVLCENLDSLDEPEAKSAMIWIIGQYADRIENSDVLLDDFLFSWHEETVEVQLTMLTAAVKLFLLRPTKGSELVPKVLKWATEETDNPDLRDRGFFYWRLISTDPVAAKDIVLGVKPPITAESEKLDPATLEEMCLNVGTLATVYLKPVQHVFRNARARKLQESPALQKHILPTQVALEAQAHKSVSAPYGTEQGSSGSNGNLAAAIDAADVYFSGLNSSDVSRNMAALNLGEDGGLGDSPTVGHHGETRYVVNQSQPQQAYHPQIGGDNGDLLL